MQEDSESEVVRAKRRRYDAALKRKLVEQTLVPGASVARIAREHGINANQVFKWRRQQLLEDRRAAGCVVETPASLVPVNVIAENASLPAATSDGVIEITRGDVQVRVRGVVDRAALDCVLSSLRR